MNKAQRLWWQQSRSDHRLFVQLRAAGAHECHLLHYLQMATEKLGKAYLWRTAKVPPKVHTGFFRFLKALNDRENDSDRVVRVLGFSRPIDLRGWVSTVQPLANSLQNIAPAEARDGPNSEYPWPHEEPLECPVEHSFQLWKELSNTGQGRKLLEFIALAVERFDQIA